MNKQESSLWSKIAPKLCRYMKLRRIENMVGEGDPDVFMFKEGWVGFMELKAKDHPKRASTSVFRTGGLRPAQINYLVELHEEVIPAFILAKAGEKIWLVPSLHALTFNTLTSSELDRVAIWVGAYSKMCAEDWDSLSRYILGK